MDKKLVMDKLSLKDDKNKTYIIVDTSYWIFYRYFAIIQWWKHAKSDQELPENPYDCPEFVEKFIKTFTESIETFKKKQKIHKQPCHIIAARDCPRKEIWRNKLYPKYKESRDKDDVFMGGNFFKLVYANDNELLLKANINRVLKFPTLEGDDIVAITKNIIREKYPDAAIYIIANDHDYLQLLDENTEIINFQQKSLRENKKVFLEADKNLFYKIVLGDKSDCIEPVFKKCGPKTAEKYYNDPKELAKAFSKEDGTQEKFDLNKKIISFSEIPEELVEKVKKQYEKIFAEL